jgi:hypothetical protein
MSGEKRGNAMGNVFGLDEHILGDIRLNGIGWIGGMLVVGASILAARWVVRWQLRRVQKILGRLKPEDEAALKQELMGKGKSGSP